MRVLRVNGRAVLKCSNRSKSNMYMMLLNVDYLEPVASWDESEHRCHDVISVRAFWYWILDSSFGKLGSLEIFWISTMWTVDIPI